MCQDVEPDLMRLAVLPLTGGAGDLNMIWMPANGVAGSSFNTLFGRPVVPIEHCATLGTVGDIILADMTQYLFGMRSGMRTETSIHVNFTTDETAFRMTMRNDGQPWWQAPLTPFQGTSTTSPFITIAT